MAVADEPPDGGEALRAARRSPGRPRLLTRDKVILAAARLAPDQLTMTRLAEELGVSTGTLYQYVADRAELVRLVIAERMRILPLPTDTGQHWSQYLREYISRVTDLLSADTAVLIQALGIEATLEPELRLTESFYAALVSRGFGLEEAVAIHAQVSAIAVGTAVGNSRERLAVREAGSVMASVDRVLDELGEDDLPLVRKAAPDYENRIGAIDGLTEALIERIARQRGEQPGTELSQSRADRKEGVTWHRPRQAG
jgi:AcrR family transcriptional regulator